jgi:flagellar secretion chaperone FliS
MWNNAHYAYAETRILTADPMELVRLMYQSAITEVRRARTHLQGDDVRARASAISKACAILTELTVALDRKNGGEYARRLAELYAYMMRRLSEANFQRSEEPLEEVAGLLATLLEGWEGAQRQLESASPRGDLPAAPAIRPTPAAWAQSEPEAYAPQAWSF